MQPERQKMNENLKIPQIETIRRTAEIFGLPVHFVRQKVSTGEVVAVRAGRKFLVNVEKFAEYLNSCTVQPTVTSDRAARIEHIKLR